MKLKTLLKDIKVIYADGIKNIDIKSLSISSQNVSSESLFICIKGEKYNGHKFKEEAKKNGAVAFVVEEFDSDFDGVQILVKNSRDALVTLAKNFYKPKKSLKVIGITGTNGKTTTSFLLANILSCAGKKVGIIGTQGVYFNEVKINLNMTTPDPIELYKYLAFMSKSGIDYVVMEVSVHAIFYNKIKEVNFYAKGLSNITPDHLDFFKTMENYSKEKLRFLSEGGSIKVANIDDEYGQMLSSDNKKIYTFSKEEGADVFAYDYSDDFSSYTMSIFNKELTVKTKMLGSYNVENVLLATTLANLMGIDIKHIKKGIETFLAVDGRMNIYKKDDMLAIIDFAHTPDAMEKLLTTVKAFTKGSLYCVFGCGGSRDEAKRSVMGEIATRLCKKAYITNDNPRNEPPKQIFDMIKKGIKTSNYEIIIDRKEAIKEAVKNMKDGDTLALLGKGAEEYIEINGIKYPYSEKEELEKWGFRG